MTSWNELFLDEKNIRKFPESDVGKFVISLENLFTERPLRLWDNCCGAGRHTVTMAAHGHKLFASDNAPNAIALTRELLAERQLSAELALADMTVCPWPDLTFHGVLGWDALHHNTLHNIQKAVVEIHNRLIPGGLFMGTLKPTKADSFGSGQEIEPGTFIPSEGRESGIPHHYFDEKEVRELFSDWEILSLAEQVVRYVVRAGNFMELNPFEYTKWKVLARRR